MIEFILGFIAGAVAMFIVDIFVDRRIEHQRKRDQQERDEALRKKRMAFHSQEVIER